MTRFSDTYIDNLFASGTYDALVELAGIICGWSGFAEQHPDRGLPPVALVFLETLTWFSQGIRSGSWTYFEATSVERQLAVLSYLEGIAPAEFVERYREGVEHWRDQERMRDHDRWIDSNESVCNQWLINLLLQNRKDLADLFA